MKAFIPAVAGMALAITSPMTIQAQETASAEMEASPVQQNAYEQLVAVLSPDALHEASFAATVKQLRQFYMDTPGFVMADKQCPGLIDSIFEQSRPAMREYHWAEANAIRELLLGIFSENLTEEQAAEGVALYSTPIGQKMILAAGQNQDLQKTMESAVENAGESVDREAFDRDSQVTTSRVIRALTPEEIREFGMMAMRTEFLVKFREIDPMIQQRKFELLNSDVLSPYGGRMEAAMENAMNAHMEACD